MYNKLETLHDSKYKYSNEQLVDENIYNSATSVLWLDITYLANWCLHFLGNPMCVNEKYTNMLNINKHMNAVSKWSMFMVIYGEQ